MGFSFDASEVKEDIVPAGQYNFMIVNGAEKETKNGHLMLSFDVAICDGEYEGRRLFLNYVVGHPNYADFAKNSVKKLSEACELPKWSDVSELNGKFFIANISHKEDSQGQMKENVSKFKPYVLSGTLQRKTINFNSTEMSTINSQNDDIPF